ncbi:MAG: SRPBCC family protein [Desulfobacterales bacterium]|nr:SRPBCC family protein [Desulfobacterales bacterium]
MYKKRPMLSLLDTYFREKNRYGFEHSWTIHASPDRVWNELSRFQDWPGWWEGLETIQYLESPPGLGRGTRIRSTWKGSLPYRLTFDTHIRNFVPANSLSFWVGGDLAGFGRCRFLADDQGTRVNFSWQVSPTKLWFKMSAPFARPLFKENHDQIMAQAEKGLQRIFS